MKMLKCAKCGKLFIPAPEHIFKAGSKTGTNYYCKWTCYNHRNDNTKEKIAYEYRQSRPAERT
jgi:predicted  nucleic acid-binding Zn-ribbon protein